MMRQLTISRLTLLSAALIAVITAALLLPVNAQISAQGSTTPVDPGPGTEYLDPARWAVLQKHADGDKTAPVKRSLVPLMSMFMLRGVSAPAGRSGRSVW